MGAALTPSDRWQVRAKRLRGHAADQAACGLESKAVSMGVRGTTTCSTACINIWHAQDQGQKEARKRGTKRGRRKRGREATNEAEGGMGKDKARLASDPPSALNELARAYVPKHTRAWVCPCTWACSYAHATNAPNASKSGSPVRSSSASASSLFSSSAST